jgi:hypothetical protein
MTNSNWVKQPKFYLGQAFANTPFFGVKLLDKNDKFTYHIGTRTKEGLPNMSTVQQIPSGSYPALMQFMDILTNCPTILKKGEYKINAKGQLPKALLDALGTDKISKATNGKVGTLAQQKEIQKGWNDNKTKAKSTYRRK